MHEKHCKGYHHSKIQKIYYWVIAGKGISISDKASPLNTGYGSQPYGVHFCCEAFPVCTLLGLLCPRLLFMPRYLAGNLLKAASKIAIVVPLVRYQAFAAILNAVLQMVKHLRTLCPAYTSDDSGTGG